MPLVTVYELVTDTALPVKAAVLSAASIVMALVPTFTFIELDVDGVDEFPLGVKTAVKTAAGSALAGVQAHVAVELDTATAAQPEIVTPPTLNSAVPEDAPEVVATMFCDSPYVPVDDDVIETLVEPCGVTALLELEATEVPALFVAVSVNV